MYSNKSEWVLLNQTYVTSENYNGLNRNSSDKCIIRSTSTLFYDLDTIAKRHSCHYIPEFSISKSNVQKHIIELSNKNAFGAKTETIVQECATEIQPKLKLLDSLQITAKKIKKKCPDESMLSSEIFLRDNDYTKRKSDSFVKQDDNRRQKFWSYAKYRTEYSNPILEEKKYKKKDKCKRTEDPCPCQLFSYACPCTDKKSFTELAKKSKSLTVTDQITSTTKIVSEEKLEHNKKYSKTKKLNTNPYCADKPTGTNIMGFSNKYEMTAIYEEPVTTISNKKDSSKLIENKRQRASSSVRNITKIENRSHKKYRQYICPNCKEKLEIISIAEDEDSLKSKKSPVYRSKEISPPSENINYKNKNVVDDTDTCHHDPPCELVPVCQILPTDNIYFNSKCVRRLSLKKHNAKKIRITKACRHHPPCLVVPSCQRMNVLKSNCDYIPPCLHWPRCINVPLCVSYSKSFNYDDLLNNQRDDIDNTECINFPSCKYVPAYQQDSPSNCVDHQYHSAQNNVKCEYVSEYSPRFILNPKIPNITPTFSPCQVPNPLPFQCCISTKSCQYDFVDCKCVPPSRVKQCVSNDSVIYVRDVGCQFTSKFFSPRDSLFHSKTSSAFFNSTSTKTGNYYSNYQTLRYEDKYTNPISGEELSMSTFTSSLEVDINCPSHGQNSGKHTTGFTPNSTASPFVAAFSTYTDPILQYLPMFDEIRRDSSKSGTIDSGSYVNTFPAMTRRSFLKGKHKNVISIKRRKTSRRNKTLSSRRMPFSQKNTSI